MTKANRDQFLTIEAEVEMACAEVPPSDGRRVDILRGRVAALNSAARGYGERSRRLETYDAGGYPRLRLV